MQKVSLFITIIIFSFTSTAKSQTYYFDNYSVAQGLYQSRVYDIVQDQNRYLWLGTMGGVSKFDGKNIENYTSQNGICVNGVQAICEDSAGIIWFGHISGGISRVVDGKFEKIFDPGKILKHDIIDILKSNDGKIWFTSDGSGAINIRSGKGKVDTSQVKRYKGNTLSDRVFDITKTPDGNIYFITDYGIKKYNQEKDLFENYHPEGLTRYWPITYFMEDSKGLQWFGTYHGGLYRYNKKTGSFKVYDIRDGLSSNWITYIAEDKNGNIWLGSWGKGITLIQDEILKIFDTGNGLPDDKIDCILPDHEGNVMIGTNEHGISIFKGEQFISYNTKQGIVNQQVWSIIQANDQSIWLGTNGGISTIDFNSGKITQNYTEISHSISNQIRHFVKDKQGNIWIGTNDQGLMKFNWKSRKFEYDMFFNRNYMPSPQVTALVSDQNNILWVGTVDGLVKFTIETDEATRLTQVNGLAGNEITSLCNDPVKGIWVGSKDKGITFINDNVFKRFQIGDGLSPSCMQSVKPGEVWIGTSGQGLLFFKNDSVVRKYSEQEGLLSNLINLLTVAPDGFVYVGTNKGMNRLDPKTGTISTYTLKSGFTGIETKKNSCIIDHTGRIWFGTVDGATVYNPKLDNNGGDEPYLQFTRLRVNLIDRPISNHMKLSYRENSIIINFHGINYSDPEAVKYMVFLDGFEKDYHLLSGPSEVNYSALSPGDYTFKVKSSNENGKWNEQPIEMNFTIKPPFYQTWWFILSSIFAGAFIIVTYIKARERQLIAEKRKLEEKVKERTLEVTQKNEELAFKNKNITDSIRYAKRIQIAILPPVIPFDNAFILFRPKDIVSGDFYWLLKQDNLEFFAAVDCTGHGVPGAFMSIIGHTMLNKIVKEYKIYEPAAILNQLNTELNNTLHSQEETGAIMDGMDISLACYHSDTEILEFAGAFNSAYIVRDGVLREIPANRFPVGRSNILDKMFENRLEKIQKGDCIYLYSDGYADQFGGPLGKKFKSKEMVRLLEKLYHEPMDIQKQKLEIAFEEWRGDIEQVDDVLVIGRKF